jgi:hypothetical protein
MPVAADQRLGLLALPGPGCYRILPFLGRHTSVEREPQPPLRQARVAAQPRPLDSPASAPVAAIDRSPSGSEFTASRITEDVLTCLPEYEKTNVFTIQKAPEESS